MVALLGLRLPDEQLLETSEVAGTMHAEQQGAYLGACAKHLAERAVARCDDCSEVWCADCLVPPTRKRQPTRCIECALVAAGVRAPGSRRGNVTSMSRVRTQRFM